LEFNHDAGVPGSGIRYLRNCEGVPSSQAGELIAPAHTLTSVTVQLDEVDTSRAYEVEVITDSSSVPIVIATVSLPTNTTQASATALTINIPTNTEIGVRLIRISGSGESTFDAINVIILMTQV